MTWFVVGEVAEWFKLSATGLPGAGQKPSGLENLANRPDKQVEWKGGRVV
jgi:hypothetical protein